MTLNTKAIDRLADLIEQCESVEFQDHEQGMGLSFTMLDLSYPCGTPACLLGHHNTLQGRHPHDGTVTLMSEEIGISREDAMDLCAPTGDDADYRLPSPFPGHITKGHAVAVLRYLANTGEVDWEVDD